MIVFDVTNEESFHKIQEWLGEIEKNAPPDICCLIVGNNCDLRDERRVSEAEARTFASSHNMGYYDVSAKENVNIDDAFRDLFDKCALRLQ